MTKEEKEIADKILLEFYDKALEIVEFLKPLNHEQLNYLKLQYDIAHKKVELNNLIKVGEKDVED